MLLRRRKTLRGHEPAQRGAPESSWADWEAHPDPIPEGIQRELADIDAALARITEGRYGTCQSCGGPMGLQRLRALPEARFCVACSGHASAVD